MKKLAAKARNLERHMPFAWRTSRVRGDRNENCARDSRRPHPAPGIHRRCRIPNASWSTAPDRPRRRAATALSRRARSAPCPKHRAWPCLSRRWRTPAAHYPILRQIAMRHVIELFGERRILRTIGREQSVPLGARRRTASADAVAKMPDDTIGHVKLRIVILAVKGLRRPRLLRPEWLAVRVLAVLLVRRAVTDVTAHDDERRSITRIGCVSIGALERLQIICLVAALHVPVIREETRGDIIRGGEMRV